jgi:hypothetical protein
MKVDSNSALGKNAGYVLFFLFLLGSSPADYFTFLLTGMFQVKFFFNLKNLLFLQTSFEI